MNRHRQSTECPGQLSIFDMENFTCDIFGTPAGTKPTVTVCHIRENTVTPESMLVVAKPWEEEEISAADGENQRSPKTTISDSDQPQHQEPVLQPDLYVQALTVIDQLGKREARRLCSSLKIQQKLKSVELSTELMIAEIRKKFQADPERVIAAIADRLPEMWNDSLH